LQAAFIMWTTIGSFGLLRAFVAAVLTGRSRLNAGVIHAWRINSASRQLWRALPVAQQDVGVEQRNLLRGSERLFLAQSRQFLRDVGNHHMPAGQDAVGGAHRLELALGEVADLHFFLPMQIAAVP